MLDDLAAVDTDDIDTAEFDAAAGGLDTHQFTLVRAGQDHIQRLQISIEQAPVRLLWP